MHANPGITSITFTVVFEGNPQITNIEGYTFAGVDIAIIYYCGTNNPTYSSKAFYQVNNKIIYSNTLSSFCGITTMKIGKCISYMKNQGQTKFSCAKLRRSSFINYLFFILVMFFDDSYWLVNIHYNTLLW